MDFNYLYSDYLETLTSLQLQESEHLLLANIDQQKMALYNQGKSVKTYVMSSSKQPPSCTENSLGTPWGLHRICEKIGQGEREGRAVLPWPRKTQMRRGLCLDQAVTEARPQKSCQS